MTTESGFRRRCNRLVATLPIPDPFDVDVFLAALAKQRGRPIYLIPADLPPALACGMLLSTDDADYIVHVVGTTPLHAQHIDMHEVGHLLLDHAAAIQSANPVPALAEQAAVRALLPDLSPKLIRRILGRTGYSNKQEREAELFASMLLSRTSHRAAGLSPGGADFADRLARLRSRAPMPAGAAWAA